MSKKETFAVIETGGKQYIVEENTVVSIEKLDAEINDKIVFDKVLLLSKDGKATVGAPYVKATVQAEVINLEKDDKVRVFKFKKKTGYKKKQGHRQQYSTVRILGFDAAAKSEKKAETKASATKEESKAKTTKKESEKKVAKKSDSTK